MSLCILCGTSKDVKRCEAGAFYGAPALQGKQVCYECYLAAIDGKKCDPTKLSESEEREKAERQRHERPVMR